MNRRLSLAFMSFFAMIAAACGDEHSLTVRVATGLVAGPEFALVRVDLIENGVAFESARTLPGGIETMASFGQSFAQGRRVAEFSDLAPGVYTVRVQLLRPDETLLIQQRIRTTLASNSIVTVHLTRDCVDVMCPSPGGSAAFSECLAGRCVSPDCLPPNESDACNDVVFCNDATECGPTASCATQVCNQGVCAQDTIEDACAPTEWCDPDVGDGCTPYVESDGGVMLDAGLMDAEVVVDAGSDATSVPCGRACVAEDAPCAAGFWDCSATTPVCARVGLRPVSTPCGDDAVCNSVGVCTSCRNGAPCRIGCSVGVTSCARGYEECVLTVPTEHATAGTSCSTSAYCVDGDACGDGDFCAEDGQCTACTPGAACLSGCEHGTVDCTMSGACIGDGTFVETGASCGDDQHCTATHACVACDEGASCEHPDVCANGRISCALGEPSCVAVSARLSPGVTCGTDQVCDTHFACVHCVPGEACMAGGSCGEGTLYCGYGPICSVTSYVEPGVSCEEGVCSGLGGCYEPYTAVMVASGDSHTCAVRSDGSLQCWGDNSSGQLGVAEPAAYVLEKVTVPLTNVRQVATGSSYTCAVTNDGIVYCWGTNAYGNLGDGTFDPHPTPAEVSLPSPALKVVTGIYHTCALLEDGTVWCWGMSFVNEFGDVLYDTIPVQKAGLPIAVELVSGPSDFGHSCVISEDREVWCWGTNTAAQLGDGVATYYEPTPIQVLGIDDAVALGLSNYVSCALRASGVLWCWGMYDAAVTLDPFADGMPQAVPLAISDGLVDIAMGYSRACVLTDANEVWCWGLNYNLSLGVAGLAINAESPPTLVSYLSDVATFNTSAGSYGMTSCATLTTGGLMCWGANFAYQAGQNFDELGVPDIETPAYVRNP